MGIDLRICGKISNIFHSHYTSPEGEERKKGAENLFEEIMAENFPNLEKEKDIQIQEAQKVPNEMIQKDQHQDML